MTQLLREERVAAGVTQEELARRLGTRQSYVSKYESGQRRLDLVELKAICEALGTTLGSFVRRFEQ